MKGLIFFLLLLTVGCGAKPSPQPSGLPPRTPDAVTQWAFPQATEALIIRHPDVLADILDTLERRYGKSELLQKDLAWVRESVSLGPIQPGARAWGPSLHLERGLAFFGQLPQRIRLIFGADDLSALDTLAEAIRPLVPTLRSANQLIIEDTVFTCAHRDQVIVCDTQGPPPEAPEAPLEWVPTDSKQDILFGFAPGSFLEASAQSKSMMMHMSLRDGLHLSIKMSPTPQLLDVLKIIGDSQTGPAGLFTDQSQFAFSIGMDPKQLGSEDDPRYRSVFDTFTGRFGLTDDGALTQLIFGAELRGKVTADNVIDTVLKVSPGRDQVERMVDGDVRAIRIHADNFNLDLYYGQIDQTMLLALHPDSVRRRVKRQAKPLDDAHFNTPGFIQLMIATYIPYFDSPWLARNINLLHGQVLASAWMAGFDRVSLNWRREGDFVKMSLETRMLPDTAQRKAYDAGMAAHLDGDLPTAAQHFAQVIHTDLHSLLARSAAARLAQTGAGSMALIGMLSAIAIPAYRTYIQRSQFIESAQNRF